MADTKTADFEVVDHGTIVQIVAHSEVAINWIDENVDAPSYMWNGTVLNIEHRFADAIIAGLIDDGLEGE